MIPNVRLGHCMTYSSLNAYPHNTLISIGTNGFVSKKNNRIIFAEQMRIIIDTLAPTGIIVYGTAPKDVFEYATEKNIPLYMYKYGIKVVVLTMGGEGITIYLFNNPEIRDEKDNKMVDCTKIHLAAMNVPEVKDTTGAGDAFWGAFLSSLVRQGVKRPEDIDKEILKEAGLCGNISGGLCITKPGGIPAIPTLKEINSIERI